MDIKSKNSNDWKDYWKNTELVPSTKEDKQLPFLIETLKKELDINKIETVLEVGIGYGRVAKAILNEFTNILLVHGIDVSESAIKQSKKYLEEYLPNHYIGELKHGIFEPIIGDFESFNPRFLYDLVISVETMSTIPENVSVQPWIDKMCKLSKKYVVNLDYWKTTHPIFNNRHDYVVCYEKYLWSEENDRGKDLHVIDIPNNPNEELYIVRVR